MTVRKRITAVIMTMIMLITLLPFGCIPAHAAGGLLQIGSTTYDSWATAVSAVQAGQTITLLNDVTLADSDTMPAATCTIDGGSGRHTLELPGDVRLRADTTFKDIQINGSHIIYAYDNVDYLTRNVKIEGNVSGAVRFRGGGEIAISGTLDCLDIYDFGRLTVNGGSSLTISDYVYVRNSEVNGTVTIGNNYFMIGGDSNSIGILSGTGTIIFSRQNVYGYNLQFANAKVDEECSITLTANYTPSEGGKLISNSGSDSAVTNVDLLTLGGNYSSFKLTGALVSSGYGYTLTASTKMALTQPTITLTPNSTNGGLTYTISDPVGGEVSGISCYRIKLFNSDDTAQIGSSIYTGSTSGSIPSSDDVPGGVVYAARVQALAKITSDYTISAESSLSEAVTAAKSPQKAITSFKIGTVTGTINDDYTITVVMPYGTDLTSLNPTVAISDMASVDPQSGETVDFTDPVTYRVTAENGDTQEYTATVTVSGTPRLQIGAHQYGTWAQAAEAVQSGETITLLDDVTILSDDSMPDAVCFIDGNSTHTLTLSSNQRLRKDIYLKNLNLDYSGSDTYGEINCFYQDNQCSIYIIGTVNADDFYIVNGSELQINGTLNAKSVAYFENLTLSSDSSLGAFSVSHIENAEIDGTVTCKYFTLFKGSGGDSGSSGNGVLSGNGSIIFTESGGEGPNLIFSNVKIDSDALIKLDAQGYTPAAEDYLVGNVIVGETGTATALDNIKCLTLGSGYSGFKLSGVNNSYEYDYELEASSTIPNRKAGVTAEAPADVAVNSAYTLNLLDIFEDAENDALTFKVSINGAPAVAANADYSYAPTAAGTTTLEFKANDGTADSTDTYKVTLTATGTGTQDTTAPAASLTSPSGTSVAVSTTSIVLGFTESVTGVVYKKVTISDGMNTYAYTIGASDEYIPAVYKVTIPVSQFVYSSIPLSLDYSTTYTVAVEAGAYTDNAGNGIAAGSIGSFATVTASVVTYTVTFKDWDGAVLKTETVNGGSAATAPSNPTRAGYTFTGWDKAFDNITSNLTVTAQYSKNSSGGSGGSSGGGGGAAAATKAYQAGITGSGTTASTLPVNVNTDAGSAVVDTGTQIGGIVKGGGTVTVTVPSIPAVTAYTLGIPVDSLSVSGGKGTLAFNSGAGNMILPSDMLAGIKEAEGKQAEITIGQGDKSGLPEAVKAAIGDRPMIRLAVTIDGKQIEWNNPDAPVTVSIPYKPTAAELADAGNIIIWYIDGNGNVASVPNGHYDPDTGTVTFTTTHFSYYAVGYNKVSFKDVAADAWYSKAVSFIAARKITTGTGDGQFSPGGKLTRGQFLVMMMRAYGITSDANPADNFADAGSTYYTGYLAAAKRLGISGGTGNNMFLPGNEITRQEMFTLLYKVLKITGKLPTGTSGKQLSSFSDAGQVASWAKDAISLMTEAGIISGNDGKISPEGTTTRAEMAQVLYRLLTK